MNYQEKLINRVILGDEKAFEELYKNTYKKVHFTCRAFLKNENDVADIEQEIYISVLNSLETLQDKSKFESWLGKITVNKCRDYLKKNSPVLVEDEILAEVLEEDDELKLPEEYVSNKAKRKILMDIIRECLSDTLYQTVILFYFHDMSAAEIAEIMDCPVGTITSRLCLARGKIKEGILTYEKKSGDKLHGIALVPVLGLLFKEEAMAMEPAVMVSNIVKTSSTKLNTVRMAESGGKAMFKTLKMKILVGVTATALIGGGVTVAVLNQSDKKAETAIEQSMEENKNNDTSSENSNDNGLKVSGENGKTDSQEIADGGIKQDEVKFEVTKYGTKIVDNELLTIEYKSFERDNKNNVRLYFDITNNSNEIVKYDISRHYSVNGFQDYPSINEQLEPLECIEEIFVIQDYFIERAQIKQIDYIDFIINMWTKDRSVVKEERIVLIPDESLNGPIPQGYQAKGTDEVVIDTKECYLVITGYEINTNYDCLEVYYYFENRMDKDICVMAINDTINDEELKGFSLGGSFFFAGNGAFDKFTCWNFSEKFTGVINHIDTEIVICDEEIIIDDETGERKVLYNKPITIEKIFQNN